MRNYCITNDIIWIKNVTSSEEESALMNKKHRNIVLYFPNRHKHNCRTPKVGEIIILYQRIDNVSVFTHLVTPVDNVVIEDELKSNYKYGRSVRVIAQVNTTSLIPVKSTLWNIVNFQGISQGNVCRIRNISKIKDVENLIHDIWNRFIPYIMNDEITIENDIVAEFI